MMLSGVVSRVYDGDTFQMKSNGFKYKIRLAQIDAPERSFFGKPAQPFSHEAYCFLYGLVINKIVTVDVESIDGYQRNVGTVLVDDLNVNREMVRAGLAWVYQEYVVDAVLIELEKDAKDNKRGIWSVDNPTNPHDFRVGK